MKFQNSFKNDKISTMMISSKMIKRIQIRSCYHMTSVIRCQHSKPDKIVSEEGVKGKKNLDFACQKKKFVKLKGDQHCFYGIKTNIHEFFHITKIFRLFDIKAYTFVANQMTSHVANANAKSLKSESPGWWQIFFNISLYEILVFLHRKLRPHKISTNKKCLTKHF